MVGNLIEDRRIYPLGQVRAAKVELAILQGSLEIQGGADAFCEALFQYSHPEIKPLDDYSVSGDEAELEITEPPSKDLGERMNSWQLAFSSSVTMSLAISSMSGSVDLNLDEVLLSNAEVKSRSGRVRTSWGGSYPDLDEILIECKSGSTKSVLNGDFPKLRDVEIESMSGSTDLAITGDCPELKRVAIDSKSGNVSVDMRGHFKRDDLGVKVENTSGRVRIVLPSGVGASMNATTVSGSINAQGFTQGPGRWTNAAFGQSPATIWLNIRVVSGSIDIVTE